MMKSFERFQLNHKARQTSLAAIGSDTHENMMSTLLTTSRGVATTLAPAARNSRHLLRVLFHTTTLWPDSRRFRTISLPMFPRPIKPNTNADGVIFRNRSIFEISAMIIFCGFFLAKKKEKLITV